MEVWGTELAIAIVLFLITFPLALMFLTYHHYHRHGVFRGWSALTTILTFFYATGVIAFTLFPFPASGTHNCVAGAKAVHFQLIPFASLADILDVASATGFPAVLRSTTFLQVLLNVVLLVPLGMLLAYRYKRSLGFTVLAGLGVSLLIEITQGTGVFGAFDCPYRLGDVDDLITNTAGAAVGWVVATALAPWLPDPTPPPNPDAGSPSMARRAFAGSLDALALVLIGVVVRALVLGVLRPADETLATASASNALAVLDTFAVAAVLFFVVPLLRDDRATPGGIATWLAQVSGEPARRPTHAQSFIRFAVRWLPLSIGAFIAPLFFLVALVMYEAVVAIARSDRRSLSAALSNTRTVTRRSLNTTESRSEIGSPGNR